MIYIAVRVATFVRSVLTHFVRRAHNAGIVRFSLPLSHSHFFFSESEHSRFFFPQNSYSHSH